MTVWSAEHFLDAHSHKVEGQAGGLLIGLEGQPKVVDTLDNAEVQAVGESNPLFLPVHYITRDFPENDQLALKYHARRESFSPGEIISDLRTRSHARLVVLDTLNEPDWAATDYWAVVRSCRDKQFVLAHGGGLDAHAFIKIVMFEPNVWVDFSYTQSFFGFTDERPVNRLVCNTIRYCLDEPGIRQRCLFGSDNPFVSQARAAQRYACEEQADALLGGNLIRLYDIIQR